MLIGAGLAVLYLATYGSHVLYGLIDTLEQKMQIFVEYHAYFTEVWNQRVNAPPKDDLISMLAHGPETRNMEPREYFGNVVLLTVGGSRAVRVRRQ